MLANQDNQAHPVAKKLTKLGDDNWLTWKREFQLWVRLNNLVDILTQDPPEVYGKGDKAHEPTEAYLTWEKRDDVLQYALIQALTKKIRSAVVTAENSSARHIYNALVRKNEDKSAGKLVNLKKQLFKTKMEHNESMTQYFAKIKVLQQNIIQSKGHCDSMEIVAVLKSNLPKDYIGLLDGFDARKDEDYPDIEEIEAKLINKEEELKGTSNTTSSEPQVLNTRYNPCHNNRSNRQNNNGNRNRRFQGKCNYCFFFGHKAKDCKSRHRDMANGIYRRNINDNGGYRPNQGRGQYGNWQNHSQRFWSNNDTRSQNLRNQNNTRHQNYQHQQQYLQQEFNNRHPAISNYEFNSYLDSQPEPRFMSIRISNSNNQWDINNRNIDFQHNNRNSNQYNCSTQYSRREHISQNFCDIPIKQQSEQRKHEWKNHYDILNTHQSEPRNHSWQANHSDIPTQISKTVTVTGAVNKTTKQLTTEITEKEITNQKTDNKKSVSQITAVADNLTVTNKSESNDKSVHIPEAISKQITQTQSTVKTKTEEQNNNEKVPTTPVALASRIPVDSSNPEMNVKTTDAEQTEKNSKSENKNIKTTTKTAVSNKNKGRVNNSEDKEINNNPTVISTTTPKIINHKQKENKTTQTVKRRITEVTITLKQKNICKSKMNKQRKFQEEKQTAGNKTEQKKIKYNEKNWQTQNNPTQPKKQNRSNRRDPSVLFIPPPKSTDDKNSERSGNIVTDFTSQTYNNTTTT